MLHMQILTLLWTPLNLSMINGLIKFMQQSRQPISNALCASQNSNWYLISQAYVLQAMTQKSIKVNHFWVNTNSKDVQRGIKEWGEKRTFGWSLLESVKLRFQWTRKSHFVNRFVLDSSCPYFLFSLSSEEGAKK